YKIKKYWAVDARFSKCQQKKKKTLKHECTPSFRKPYNQPVLLLCERCAKYCSERITLQTVICSNFVIKLGSSGILKFMVLFFKNTTDDTLENDSVKRTPDGSLESNSFKRTPDGSLDNYRQKKILTVMKTADDDNIFKLLAKPITSVDESMKGLSECGIKIMGSETSHNCAVPELLCYVIA
ncbi:hypothetical protein L9F63_018723, partial [Diploptera punctata]